ncbi:MAG: hypothetical protein QW478_15170 [Candidatus Micrarchaeaceae archaeon]
MTKKWIQHAIKHKGSLTTWAKKHKFYKNNKIQLNKAYKYAKAHKLTKRLRQINLARNLRKFRK